MGTRECQCHEGVNVNVHALPTNLKIIQLGSTSIAWYLANIISHHYDGDVMHPTQLVVA